MSRGDKPCPAKGSDVYKACAVVIAHAEGRHKSQVTEADIEIFWDSIKDFYR
jgi:hypothetical protein